MSLKLQQLVDKSLALCQSLSGTKRARGQSTPRRLRKTAQTSRVFALVILLSAGNARKSCLFLSSRTPWRVLLFVDSDSEHLSS